METKFFINSMGNQPQKVSNSSKKSSINYSQIKNAGLQQDTFTSTFTGNNKEESSPLSKLRQLLLLAGFTATGATTLAGCNPPVDKKNNVANASTKSAQQQAVDKANSKATTAPAAKNTGINESLKKEDIEALSTNFNIPDKIKKEFATVSTIYSGRTQVQYKPAVSTQKIISKQKANQEQYRSKKNVAYSLRDSLGRLKFNSSLKKAGINVTNDGTGKNSLLNNAAEQILQSNPSLGKAIPEIYGMKNLDELAEYADSKGLNYYDLVLDAKLSKAVKNQVASIKLPNMLFAIPDSDDSKIGGNEVTYKTYTAKRSTVDVDSKKTAGKLKDGEYQGAKQAIIKEYNLDSKSAGYNAAVNAILFQTANDPRNFKKLGADASKLNDNQRTDLLLKAGNIKGLHLPDNVVVSNVGRVDSTDDNKYLEYITTNKKIYEIAPSKYLKGKKLGKDAVIMELDKKIDLSKPVAGQVRKLNDILQYYTTPGENKPLMLFDKNGVSFMNINTKADEEIADAAKTSFIYNSDNLGIFTAPQTINGKYEMFGAFDVIDYEMADLIKDKVESRINDKMTAEEKVKELASIRKEVLAKHADGKIENFMMQIYITT